MCLSTKPFIVATTFGTRLVATVPVAMSSWYNGSTMMSSVLPGVSTVGWQFRLLYAEPARIYGLQAVDTRCHSMKHSTTNSAGSVFLGIPLHALNDLGIGDELATTICCCLGAFFADTLSVTGHVLTVWTDTWFVNVVGGEHANVCLSHVCSTVLAL